MALAFALLPTLLCSDSIKKFVVGYEMLANAQRDITAQAAAKSLQAISKIHYSEASFL